MVVKYVELTMKPVRAGQIIGRWWSRRRNPCNIDMNYYV